MTTVLKGATDKDLQTEAGQMEHQNRDEYGMIYNQKELFETRSENILIKNGLVLYKTVNDDVSEKKIKNLESQIDELRSSH